MDIYDRAAVTDYAVRWARSCNPRYADFSGMGGECSNFASQCIYTGCGIMNFSAGNGWYYENERSLSPSWANVRLLYNFLTSNTGAGPYAMPENLSMAEPGDLIQLQNEKGEWYHSVVVLGNTESDILVAAHDDFALYRPLTSFPCVNKVLLHILGYRR